MILKCEACGHEAFSLKAQQLWECKKCGNLMDLVEDENGNRIR